MPSPINNEPLSAPRTPSYGTPAPNHCEENQQGNPTQCFSRLDLSHVVTAIGSVAGGTGTVWAAVENQPIVACLCASVTAAALLTGGRIACLKPESDLGHTAEHLQTSIQQLEEEQDRKKQELEKLQGEIGGLNTLKADLEAAQKQIQAEKESNIKEMEKLTGKLTALNTEYQETLSRLQATEESLKKLEAERQTTTIDMENTVKLAQDEKNRLSEKNKELSTTVSAMETQNGELSQNLLALKKIKLELDEKIKTLQTEKEALQGINDDLSSQLKITQEQLWDNTQALETLKETADGLMRELQKNQEAADTAEAANSAFPMNV